MPRATDENQRIKDERREAIIKAATKVFAHRGLAATKISDITEAAGISQGLIYHYFSSKDELFNFLVKRAVTGALEVLETVLVQPLTAWEKLETMTRLILEGVEEEPQTFTLVGKAMSSQATSPELMEAISYQSQRYQLAFHDLLVEGQARGEVAEGDVDEFVRVFFLCVQGLAIELAFYGHLNPRRVKAETLLRIFKA